MVTTEDLENVVKASQGATLLVEDLRAMASSRNPLLAELSTDMLKAAVELEQKLKRIEVISRPGKG